MRNKEFWDYHRGRMRELGTGINYFKLSRFVMYRILDAVFNPKRTIEGLLKRIVKTPSPKQQHSARGARAKLLSTARENRQR